MAAANSSPDLSVVSEQEALPGSSPVADPGPPAPAAEAAPADTQEPRRLVLPWWLLAAVAAGGAVLFLSQYQRAQRLEARVDGLQVELAEAGQRLSLYQAHLDSVRARVGAVFSQVAGLKSLVDVDPLNPPPVELPADFVVPPPSMEPLPDVAAPPPPAEAIAPQASSSGEESAALEPQAEADVPAGPVPVPVEGESIAIRDGALSVGFDTALSELY